MKCRNLHELSCVGLKTIWISLMMMLTSNEPLTNRYTLFSCRLERFMWFIAEHNYICFFFLKICLFRSDHLFHSFPCYFFIPLFCACYLMKTIKDLIGKYLERIVELCSTLWSFLSLLIVLLVKHIALYWQFSLFGIMCDTVIYRVQQSRFKYSRCIILCVSDIFTNDCLFPR